MKSTAVFFFPRKARTEIHLRDVDVRSVDDDARPPRDVGVISDENTQTRADELNIGATLGAEKDHRNAHARSDATRA